ncbi:MAG TPA: deoxyribodipyrimidine photo-lyase, partial [Verrucomicrobiae bacterium]|nr:deoxyribodipyrimidine photo-lyase [Verrucomicrobiae bacterium]
MEKPSSLVWFRLDLRLNDQPALHAAITAGGPVIPVFIHAPDEEAPWEPGAASRWWLHQSLKALDASFRCIGSRLIIRHGPTLGALRSLAKQTGAQAIFYNRRYEPAVLRRDEEVHKRLSADGLRIESCNAALLREPWTVKNRSGKPFQVFTPFWRHCLALDQPEAPLPAPSKLSSPERWPESVALEDLGLEPRIDWAHGLRSEWQPGETGAAERLNTFLAGSFPDYSRQRDLPSVNGTSRLSPHLHFGEIGPRQVWHGLRRLAQKTNLPTPQWQGSQFIAELGWREFAYHLLYHFPHTPERPLRREFEGFPWRSKPEWLKGWQKGLTGYPIVDAGMRQLWETGWMHNRVRMIVASFLVKDLMIPWQEGARWFWDTLVDADLANNTLGWQWTAGCGADAAPFFRVFNPATQGERYDPTGDYIRRWCPELASLAGERLHQLGRAEDKKPDTRAEGSYPRPIVSHVIAREVALEAFTRFKRAGEAGGPGG